MKNNINIAVVGLGQVGIYLLNELNTKKKDIELKTGKKINVIAVSARSIVKKRRFKIKILDDDHGDKGFYHECTGWNERYFVLRVCKQV